MSITPGNSPSPAAEDGWQATRAETTVATQLMSRDEDDTAAGERDIGRQINSTQHELFVSCDPAEAMQQQFDHLLPEFIAIHDIGTLSSRKLIAGVAVASGRSIQKLVIRRQGYGTPLATLEFVDFAAGNKPLRIYTTEADADTTARQELARILLSYSRLGVVMVGDMPPHLLASSFEPLHEAMIADTWRNRHLLLLPLATSSAISGTGTTLGRGTRVNVRTTPQVTRPADAWSYISGTWNRLREQLYAEAGQTLPGLPGASVRAPAATAPSAAPTQSSLFARPSQAGDLGLPSSFGMKPMPSLRGDEPSGTESPLTRYVNQLCELTGMVSAAVFDVNTGQSIVHAGARPGPDELGQYGASLLMAMTVACRSMGLGHALPEAAITLGAHHLLLRAVPNHSGLALHAVLDKTHANLTLARLQINRMDSLLDAPATGI